MISSRSTCGWMPHAPWAVPGHLCHLLLPARALADQGLCPRIPLPILPSLPPRWTLIPQPVATAPCLSPVAPSTAELPRVQPSSLPASSYTRDAGKAREKPQVPGSSHLIDKHRFCRARGTPLSMPLNARFALHLTSSSSSPSLLLAGGLLVSLRKRERYKETRLLPSAVPPAPSPPRPVRGCPCPRPRPPALPPKDIPPDPGSPLSKHQLRCWMFSPSPEHAGCLRPTRLWA